MTQPLRFESPERTDLITIRTRASRLWFVNNKPLEDKILAYLARYRELRSVKLYAFALQGNHHHHVANFPLANRAHFMRDFNSITARLVQWNVPGIEPGKFWERRYANQLLPRDGDIEKWFFYCALQCVSSGLAEKISDYPGYNSFNDAISGIERKFKVVNWTGYNNAKRFNPLVNIKDYITVHVLKYERLPGYEHLSQHEYKKLMLQKLEEKRVEIVKERYKKGLGFFGRQGLLATKPGTMPKSTKKSTRHSKRPLVLSSCFETWKKCMRDLLNRQRDYHDKSADYLSGKQFVRFPSGTYKPPLFLVPQPA